MRKAVDFNSLTLCDHYVFKRVFADPANSELTRQVLQEVLGEKVGSLKHTFHLRCDQYPDFILDKGLCIIFIDLNAADHSVLGRLIQFFRNNRPYNRLTEELSEENRYHGIPACYAADNTSTLSHLFNIKIQKLWNTDMRTHQLLDSFFLQQDSSGLLPQTVPQGYWLLPLTFWRAQDFPAILFHTSISIPIAANCSSFHF